MLRFSVPVLLLCAMPVSAAPVPERVPDLVKALKDGKPGERVIAAEMLGDLGPNAEGAIPELAEVIRVTPTPAPIQPWSEPKWSREESAAHFLFEASWDALARIGPKAVPVLAELLAHKDVEIRGRAAEVLKSLGPGAADAVPALVKRLGDGENQRVCSKALAALAAIGPKAEAAIPALITTVLDPKATVPEGEQESLRAEAAQALKAIGPKALVAVKRDLFPAIIQALDADRNEQFRSNFGSIDDPSVWMRFGADAAPLVPALVRHLSRHNKSPLIPSLLKLGPDGEKALADLLSDKDERARRERFIALCADSRQIFDSGEADFRPIMPQLIPFLKDKDNYVRLVALANIDRYSPTIPPEVVKAVLLLLDDAEFMKYLDTLAEQTNQALTNVIVRLRGPVAIPKLLKDLESDDNKLRAYALRELSDTRSGPRAEALLPVLRELAAGKKKLPGIPPWIAARMAIRISLDPKDVELHVPFLKSDDPTRRETAAFELSRLRHLARPHLKHLLPLLKDQNDYVRKFAAQAIREIIRSDPDARAALDKWIVDSGYDGPFVKELTPDVSDALKMFKRGEHFNPLRGLSLVWQIGPAAKDAVPFLLPYLTREFDDPTMRETANGIEPDTVLRALGAIGPGAKDAVPLIRKQLANAKDQEKTWYLLCLADIGPGAKDAVPDLKELLIDPNPRLRLLAACALSKIEADPVTYRATFARLIHDRPGCVLWSVPDVFERIAADNLELSPVVVRGVLRVDPLRLSAPYTASTEGSLMPALKRHASAAKAAVPDLVNYLNNPPPWAWVIQKELIELLGAIGPDAKAALPTLRELLDSSDFEMALAAHGAIQKIEAKK
jgi:HEAT repeat protein